ncbi:helix-turn-helix domain-containing protein [Aneurinibacillus terranovensis]|uniref:helix-turn-helix domain-containing protein n=1 Tax=Aneurinibacillus terranovensis TaxID=278991 RepID=UPI0004004BCC|nr:XRE family transcriptional regulator [Aneurinibacillus terranovensis]
MNLNVGKRLKELRKEKKMTLKQVAEKTNLSISFISQVERSQSSVTLTSLNKIAMALGVSINDFFPANYTPKASILRKEEQKEFKFENSNFIFTSLSGNIENPVFEPLLATLLPGEKKATPYSHEGQEFGYVLQGTLTILLENEKYDLHAGDSIHINSSVPHNWINMTQKPVQVLWVNSPPLNLGAKQP